MFSKRHFILGALFGLVLLFSYFYTLPDGKLHLVFCDVGQGDASYIRTPDGSDMLIDGGPNDNVLTCLGKHMPFYDRTIDMVVLTHPQKDHLQGLISVLERYNVRYFVIGVEGNQTEGYEKLVNLINEKKITYKNLYRGDYFNLSGVKFSVIWPERDWVAEKTGDRQLSSIEPGRAVLGLATNENVNDFSYVLSLKYGDFDALYTGDADSYIQPQIMAEGVLPDIEVLKFPHHGSKTGILPEFLDKIKPELAVISVGKNPWGHPTNEALNLLKERGIKVERTDRKGDIEVVTNGHQWGLN